MTTTEEDLLFENALAAKMRETVDAVLAEMVLRDRPAPARVVYIVPGEAIVWDSTDDCQGGQLTIRLSALAPHRSGTKTATLTPCSIDYWTATLEVIMLRCAAVVDNQGMAPSSLRLAEDGQNGLNDLGGILRAISALEFVDDITQWTPQGPTGGMYGNGWFFTTKMDATPC